MKKLIRTLTLTIGVCLALLCSVQAIELKTGIGIVETNGLRLRAKPSTEADILDNASYGDNVVIIRESGDFYLVDYNLQIGYMAKGYVTFKERENVELGYGKVVDASVNMRAKPASASDLAATLNDGDKAYIIGFNCGWYKVQYNGLTGYIRSDLLELTEKPKTNTGGAVSAGQQLVDLAKQYLGTPYVWGGTTPSGFDCSGFTQYLCNAQSYGGAAALKRRFGHESSGWRSGVFQQYIFLVPRGDTRRHLHRRQSVHPRGCGRREDHGSFRFVLREPLCGCKKNFLNLRYERMRSRTDYLCDFFFIFPFLLTVKV